MLKKSLLTIYVALSATLLAGVTLAPQPAHAQQAGKLSKKVGDPLAEALALGKKGQYGPALAKLKQADAVSGKTAFEQFKVNETYGFIYSQQRNYGQAAVYFEKSLNSGQLPAGQTNERLKQLAQLNFQAPRNLNKVVDYSNRYLKAVGGNDPAMNAMLGQAYQMMGNHKAAIASVQTAVRQSGKPAENWLRILLQSYNAIGDANGAAATTDKLIALYPTNENFRMLASDLRSQARGDEAINVYRLMSALDLITKPKDCTDAAITAITSDVPAEALQFIERCTAKNLFDLSDARNLKIQKDAQQKVQAQLPRLPALSTQAASAPGPADVLNAGDILLSHNQAAKALAAAKRAQKLPGVDVDAAWMLVGRSQIQLKNGGEARKAFANVKGAKAAAVAKLWGIYASRI